MTRTPRGNPPRGDQALGGHRPGLPARGRCRAVAEAAPPSTSTSLQLGLGLGLSAETGLWARRRLQEPRIQGRGAQPPLTHVEMPGPRGLCPGPRTFKAQPAGLVPPQLSERGDVTDETAFTSHCSHGDGEVSSTFLLKDGPVTYTRNNFNANTEVKRLKEALVTRFLLNDDTLQVHEFFFNVLSE